MTAALAFPDLSGDELIHLYIVARAPLIAIDLADPERRPIFERLAAKGYLEEVRIRRCGIAGCLHGLSPKGVLKTREVWGEGTAQGLRDIGDLTREEEDAIDLLRTLSWQSEQLLAARFLRPLPGLVGRGLVEQRRRPDGSKEPLRFRLALAKEVA